MKNTKFKSIFGIFALVLFLMALCACGKESEVPETTQGDLNYQVTVLDPDGNPFTTGVIVEFYQGETKVGMAALNDNGVAAKNLPAGDYTVKLVYTDSNASYYYSEEGLELTGEKASSTVTLYQAAGAPASLAAAGQDATACPVQTGVTYVKLTPGNRSYFLFTPTEPGLYEFSTSDANASVGYYGAPHYVQSNSVAEVKDNTFTVSVRASMIGTSDTGTNVLVIGVDTDSLDSCFLTVRRIGDPERSIEDEPWIVYDPTVSLQAYTLPEGAQIAEFDLTAATGTYTLVYNEADGFYHLDTADGPLVLVRLGVDSKYLACFKTILDSSGVMKYFFDEDGTFVKKESYSECLLEYIGSMDEANGVYPLTKDLQYIIQQRADHSGWFTQNADTYLFKDENGNNVPGINPELMWLFMCCYIAG